MGWARNLSQARTLAAWFRLIHSAPGLGKTPDRIGMSCLPGLKVLTIMRETNIITLLFSLAQACSNGRSSPDADIPPPDGRKSPTLRTEDLEGGVIGGGPVGVPSAPTLVVSGPALMSDALARINRTTSERGLPVRQVTTDDMRVWFDENKFFSWTKAERKVLQESMTLGEFAAGWTLTLEQIVLPDNSPWRITLCGPPMVVEGSTLTSCGTVAEGEVLYLHTNETRKNCQAPEHNLCDEPFKGPLASADPVALSPSVETRVEPIQVAGQPMVPELAERDALAVSVKLSADSIPALVDYFAVGYDRAALQTRMRTLLGAEPSRWVQVQEFMFGWIRERANTFPQGDDNDVCHGPARLFYSDILYNDGYDRSTEHVAVLLTDHYCPVADDSPPRFGDYLYNPGAHSARYILKDPATGRDVIFSVQSGGTSAYRFYWADEDMSGHPFAHQPLPDYRATLVDTWRRCR
jgi:hypothetical protein